jgi:hypothetical protein
MEPINTKTKNKVRGTRYNRLQDIGIDLEPGEYDMLRGEGINIQKEITKSKHGC